jgi:hypothetical protein
MPAGNTYTPIATQTLGSAAASVTFSSISGAYTDLVLVLNGKYASTSDSSPSLQFNGDTSTNYSETGLNGDGSTASSFRESNISSMTAGSMSADQSTSIFNIMNYSNTTTYKTVISRGNNTTYRVRAYVGLWRSTSAINSITVLANASGINFATGSTFSLYGIASA